MTASVNDRLAWHDARRAQGVPTLTVLVGPVGLCVRAWRTWAAHGTRSVARVTAGPPDAVCAAWVAEAFAGANPVDRAVAWLRSSTDATFDLGRMTGYDLDQLWRSLPVVRSPAAAAAYRLLAGAVVGDRTTPDGFVRDVASGPDRSADVGRVYRAACDLDPTGRPPALLVLPPGDSPGWLARPLRDLESVVAVVPHLPVAVAVPVRDYDALAAEGNTRAVALAREGLVEVRGVTAGELSARLAAAGVAPPPPVAAVRRVTDAGLSAEAAAAFVTAAVTRAAPVGPIPAGEKSPFRSAAEQFLFEALESLPETTGLFRPNRNLPFPHGRKAGEADLLADRLNLVVEVDGGYYHLTADQYRRDREKDWLYQRHGYLVLRFLAEDVTDLDLLPAVCDSIREAVAFRRSASALPHEVSL